MKTLLAACLLLIMVNLTAKADVPEIEIHDKADSVAEALESVPVNHIWAWDLIRVRLMLQGGIDIPFITRFSVNSEIELWFYKK